LKSEVKELKSEVKELKSEVKYLKSIAQETLHYVKYLSNKRSRSLSDDDNHNEHSDIRTTESNVENNYIAADEKTGEKNVELTNRSIFQLKSPSTAFFKNSFTNYYLKQMILDFYHYNLFSNSSWGEQREITRCNSVMQSVQKFINRILQSNKPLVIEKNSSAYVKNAPTELLLDKKILNMKFEVGNRTTQDFVNWLDQISKYSSAISYNYLIELLAVETAIQKVKGEEAIVREKKAYVQGIESRIVQITNFCGYNPNRKFSNGPKFAPPSIAITFLNDPISTSIQKENNRSQSSIKF